MHRRLLHFGRDEHTSREDEVRIGLADGVLEVEPSEEDRGCRNGYLAEEEPLAQFLDQVGEPYPEAVVLSRSTIAKVGGPRGGEARAGVEMVSRVGRVPEVGRHGGGAAGPGGMGKEVRQKREASEPKSAARWGPVMHTQ